MATCNKVVVALWLVVVGVVAGLPEQTRYVNNPKTANQLLDNIIEKAVDRIINLGWNVSKNVQNGDAQLPMEASSGTNETLTVTKASITGLGSLRRSKTASFNADKTVLTGTIVVEDAEVTGEYTAKFPGVGEAPSQTISGTTSEKVQKLFADVEVNLLDGLVPNNIRSYVVRSGHDEVNTNITDDNAMKPLHEAGFRKALRQILESTMGKNIKVQFNKGIMDIKNAATAA